MTREETREAAAVMLAWADGKEIEYASNQASNQTWRICTDPLWNWQTNKYRIEPTKKLRPWTADEVPLGAWMRENDKEYRRIIMSTSYEYEREKWLKEWEHSTDCGKTWLPCGVEVNCE